MIKSSINSLSVTKTCITRRFLFLVVIVVPLLAACAATDSSALNKRSSPSADRALIHAQLASEYLQEKRYAVARSELNQALKIDPSHSDSNYVMGLLMMQLEQFPEAEQHFVKALKSNPDNSAAAHDFGLLLCQIGKQSRSVEYFELAASNPLFERPELSLMRAGECLVLINDPRAEEYLQRALTINPKLSPALQGLATIRYNMGEYLSARAFIERYFAVSKPRPVSLLLAYKIESRLNANAAANSYRAMLLSDFPASDQAKQLRRSKH